VKTITRDGFGDMPDEVVRQVCEEILTVRAKSGNGA
jgi:hypothetical protein